VLRLFVDLEHATSHDLDSVIAPIEHGRLDFNQAFAELRLPVGKGKIVARVGRQEVGIGNQTVFDMREGANTRRSFDVARVMVQAGRWDGGVLAGYAVLEKIGSFDDRSNHDFDLAAAHLGRSFGSGANTGRIEALFLRSDRASLAFDTAAAARDQRRTLSLRYAGKAKAWSLDLEGIRQWGRFGQREIDAWYLTTTLAHAWQHGWKPRLALRLDVASGDKNPADGKVGTYISAFARPLTYNGDLGAQNMTVVQPMLSLQPAKKLAIDLTAAGLWRTSTSDGVYSLGGQVLRRAAESDRHFFGKRATIAARYTANPFTTLGFYLNVTKLAEDLPPSRDLRYAATYPERDLGQPVAEVAALRDADVAGQRGLEAATHRAAAHRRDHRLRQVAQVGQRRVVVVQPRAPDVHHERAVLRARDEFLHAVVRDEAVRHAAGEDDHAHARVAPALDVRREFAHSLRGHVVHRRVHPPRDDDAAVLFDLPVGHLPSSSVDSLVVCPGRADHCPVIAAAVDFFACRRM